MHKYFPCLLAELHSKLVQTQNFGFRDSAYKSIKEGITGLNILLQLNKGKMNKPLYQCRRFWTGITGGKYATYDLLDQYLIWCYTWNDRSLRKSVSVWIFCSLDLPRCKFWHFLGDSWMMLSTPSLYGDGAWTSRPPTSSSLLLITCQGNIINTQPLATHVDAIKQQK